MDWQRFQPPRLELARLPTPLARLQRLESALGAAGPIYVKRDDLTGLEMSGNKVRKLEYIAAAALADGVDTLITEGTPQSNHCRATAAVCARLGMQAVLLLRPPAPPGAPVGNHLLDALLGADMRQFTRAELNAQRPVIVQGVLDELAGQGRRGRYTPPGASEPLGCWGYIRAAAELAAQLDERGVHACDIVAGVSSGGTHAGLALGAALLERAHWAIWAVPVSDDVAFHTREVGALYGAAVQAYGLPTPAQPQLRFLDGFIGEGYGVPTPEGLDALRLLARTEALLLDPVYTAKAFAALLEGVRSGRFARPERPAVFIHTGGIFSNFAWPELLSPSA